MADIRISDISNGTISTVDGQYVWSGTGVFDKLMEAVNGNVKVEFDNGRINSEQYATVYLGALQSAISASMDFLLKEQLIEAQIDQANAETAKATAEAGKIDSEASFIDTQKAEALLNGVEDRKIKAAQEALYKRQKDGFDDNVRQKLFDSQVNSWGLMYSAGMLDPDAKPDFVGGTQVTTLYNNILNGLDSQ